MYYVNMKLVKNRDWRVGKVFKSVLLMLFRVIITENFASTSKYNKSIHSKPIIAWTAFTCMLLAKISIEIKEVRNTCRSDINQGFSWFN